MDETVSGIAPASKNKWLSWQASEAEAEYIDAEEDSFGIFSKNP